MEFDFFWTRSDPLQVIDSRLPGVKLLELQVHRDGRGYFVETYDRRRYQDVGIEDRFVLDAESLSATPGTVRGLHFQTPPHAQAKLMRCLSGRLFDVVVDLRRGSPTFGHHETFELAGEDGRQLYVPEGFAHGFCTLEANTRVAYKLSDHYSPGHAKGIRWDDPDLGIEWPELATPEMSEADVSLPFLKDFPFVFE